MLLAKEIKSEIEAGNILVEPFIEENLAVNSIDVRLQDKLVTYMPIEIVLIKTGKYKGKYKVTYKQEDLDNVIIDPKEDNETFEYDIPEEGLLLDKHLLYLGSTIEKAGSEKYVPMYEGRSSMARLGIQSHISAGFGDINFKSNWTLEIIVVHNTFLYPNMRIGQVYFQRVDEDALEDAIKYKGKYGEQTSPQKSKSHLDFKTK